MPDTLPGMGTTLSYNATAMVQIKNMDYSGFSRSDIDITTLDSPRKTYRGGILEPGEFSFELQFDRTAHATLITAMTADFSSADHAAKVCVVEFPDNSTFTFTAYLKSFALNGIEEDGIVAAPCTLKLDGKTKPTFAAGAP